MAALNHRPGKLNASANALSPSRSVDEHARRPHDEGAFRRDLTSAATSEPGNMREVERALLIDAFMRFERNITHTAKHLGLARSTVRDRLKRYGVVTRATARATRHSQIPMRAAPMEGARSLPSPGDYLEGTRVASAR